VPKFKGEKRQKNKTKQKTPKNKSQKPKEKKKKEKPTKKTKTQKEKSKPNKSSIVFKGDFAGCSNVRSLPVTSCIHLQGNPDSCLPVDLVSLIYSQVENLVFQLSCEINIT